ncbi:FAD-dependent monooxygenase [Catenuloplanes atrovinosus]|uniref:2-polyprenyl-6-methoxyphenol hydroxylase-like FAD-dependent oxidoreductase n=1 Tax=Catenuloplanes atrovinosus TaxID=137266 RepID=A0AAE3YR64_9ACTN|nr:FAD-dependent monooxygenase [Catenuloplanes atrovinosus]MDR7276933.1 2-polyprenyl-6-methoxyphenol hydroxylase-like FAD-dependent oxidoreductase [Catenuloplanes atrovinosus]
MDVVVVGAGPTGLWLAGELRLGGASVTVLESRPERDRHSKALTVHPRTLEIFDTRGVVDRFLAEGLRVPNGHFASLPDRLDFSVLDTPYPYTLVLPQARTEELLEERARALGAVIRRGVRVAGLAPDGVRLDDGSTVAGRYVAGCDGTRSTIRDAAGIGFPGTDTTVRGWLADVVLDAPPAGGVLTLSGPHGGLMVVPMPGGLHRLVGVDARPADDRAPTLDEVRATVLRVAGTDFGMRDPDWLSRFGNAARQADAYRRGRVLLAGDAAHMHFPAGGVGMNVGIQDAHNLGWKLAAVAGGRAPDALLDTYHAERHPVGAELLEHTRAQTALMTAYSADGQALRRVLSGLIATVPGLSRALAERLSGLSVTYPAGPRTPDRPLPDGGTLFTRLRAGGHVGTVRPDGHPAG